MPHGKHIVRVDKKPRHNGGALLYAAFSGSIDIFYSDPIWY